MEFNPSAIGNDSIVLAIFGYLAVFMVLVTLFIVFYNMPRVLNYLFSPRAKKTSIEQPATVNEDIPGEVNAAIATAIHLYLEELHDDQDMQLTIQKISKNYAPWSSKIYGLLNQNQFRNQLR